MKMAQIGSFLEREMATVPCVVDGVFFDQMSVCLYAYAPRPHYTHYEEEKMIKSARKRKGFGFGRPSTYPVPRGLVIGLWGVGVDS
jgi:hypothetical protein